LARLATDFIDCPVHLPRVNSKIVKLQVKLYFSRHQSRLKVRLNDIIALRAHTSELYGTSPAIWDHTYATCHPTQVNMPRPITARNAGTRPTGRDIRLSCPR